LHCGGVKMIPVKITRESVNTTIFVDWMKANIGKYGTDWEWVDSNLDNLSVFVTTGFHATLITLRWK
jgi:hypothetical protein